MDFSEGPNMKAPRGVNIPFGAVLFYFSKIVISLQKTIKFSKRRSP
jgi:hypothetical protein